MTNVALEPRPADRPKDEQHEHTGTRALLRHCIGLELEALSARLAGADAGPHASGTRGGRVALANLQGRIRWLGQLLAGLADPRDLHLDPESAGFGSTVHVTDASSGEKLSFTLMTGSTIDVTGDQVSIESPIGASLVGARPADVVEVETPAGRRRFRVEQVRTLVDRFGEG